MSAARLDAILDAVRTDLAHRKARETFGEVAARARARGRGRSIRTSLSSRPGVIAEIKRASPSRGWIRRDLDAAGAAAAYAAGGACAVSVLTERRFFGGSLEDLERAAAAAGIPVLRKDFVLDEYMVAESRAHGADIVLLIVAVLGARTEEMVRAAREFGMDALVEVHDEAEMEVAASSGAALVGINNRDLRTFTVDLGTAARLLPLAPPGAIRVVESGIRRAGDVRELAALGADAFLVGEALVEAEDPAGAVGVLLRGAAR